MKKATINAIFKFAIKKGYLSQIFQAEFPPLSKNSNYREALTIEEWRTIYNFMRSNEFLDKTDTLKVRHFVRDFTVLLANTGLRFGEARRLKWKHCKVVRGKKNDGAKLCEIKLTAEMTKNRKPRTVQGMRGDVLTRIKSYSNYTKPNDYVFVDNNSGNQMDKRLLLQCMEVHVEGDWSSHGCKRDFLLQPKTFLCDLETLCWCK